MNLFNARFDITDGSYVDESTYRIVGIVVDNTGTYYGFNVQEGDIIYADGSMLGVELLRYKVKAINEVNMAEVDLDVSWDMVEGIDPQEPFGGIEAIIGGLHPNGLTANLTAYSYNGANEVLVARAEAYQTMLLGLKSSGGDGGSAPDLSEVNKKINSLEEKINSVQLEWEDLVQLSFK